MDAFRVSSPAMDRARRFCSTFSGSRTGSPELRSSRGSGSPRNRERRAKRNGTRNTPTQMTAGSQSEDSPQRRKK